MTRETGFVAGCTGFYMKNSLILFCSLGRHFGLLTGDLKMLLFIKWDSSILSGMYLRMNNGIIRRQIKRGGIYNWRFDMNNRSGLVTFFLFLFLLVVVILQVLSMIQSERLYKRLNHVLDMQKSVQPVKGVQNR